MGRPKKPDNQKRNIKFTFRMTEEEVRVLGSLCEVASMPAADVVRACVFKNRLPKGKVAKLDRQTYVELKRIGNNINQIAKQLNSKFEVPSGRMKAIDALSEKLNQIIILLLHDR
ncbi:plasmid mobilization relaxosome protein MobC [Echinicola vietnamensis]|uniref:Bacterial mobilization protein (MobC) n=1 Tax=Echinicola vietnamensis (strain DSM 17526 / LMG 23754 / KMM 6221) TaxID=926556 RepID=L0FTU7_ECHVK|nr:plasmid mobilization relaxosome protein MobC [Echinicola vietnamensis]AGA76722.1 Bacterial mobilization protein (MobC) [Echinicola vietnamensis DSM 17526]